jgi:hypothetical protein
MSSPTTAERTAPSPSCREAIPWFFGRPTVEELRLDLRAVLRRCRPDWDISSVEQRAAWAKGDKASFYPYGRTQAQAFADQD